MPGWTKTNFQDLEDRSPVDAPMQWRLARSALHSPELGVSRFTYRPGARMPFGHRHREQEEAYVVVGGSGRAKLDDEIIEIVVWDVLRVAPPGGARLRGRPGRPRPDLHRRPQAQARRHRATPRLLEMTANLVQLGERGVNLNCSSLPA